MTSQPPDDDERTRIANPDDERTRLGAPADERPQRAAPEDEQTRIAAPPAERTRLASPGAAPTVMMTASATTLAASPAASGSLGHNAFEVGTKIGEFEILDLVGEGGFGIVYLAYDHSLDRKVALKEYMPAQLAAREGGTVVMRSDRHAETFAAGLRSFINEARLLAQFDHHSLVKVYRFWEANGTAYMVMPFYEGITLKRALKDLGAPPDEAWLRALLAHLLDALEIIHGLQCYHRDIAPDNILILPDETPVLLDFGAARRVIGDMTQALTVILKPGYAPVEQYAEIPDMRQGPWTDLYALASVVYFAITGKAPIPSVARVMSDSLVPLSQSAAGRYSETFLRAIDSALAVKPEARPQSIAEFRRALGFAERAPTTRIIPSTADRAPAVATVAPAAVAPSPGAAPAQPAAPSASPPAARAAPRASSTVKYASIGGVLAALVMGGYLYLGGKAEPDMPKAGIEAPAVSPVAAPVDVIAQAREKLAGFECARLEAAMDGGTAVVRGHVANEADLRKLSASLSTLKGPRVSAAAVQVVPSSYCGVLAAFAPYVKAPSAPPGIGLRGGATAAFEGDKLIVEATAAEFAGFVYVDLYDQEGNVVHLLPNSKEKKNQVQPGQRVVVGDDGMFGMQWDIVPPLGKHLVVATVSRGQLFDRARPDMEPAGAFAGVLQEALRKQPESAVNYRFVDFSPQR